MERQAMKNETKLTRKVCALVNKLNAVYSRFPRFSYHDNADCDRRFPDDSKLFNRLDKQFQDTIAAIRREGNDVSFDLRGAYIPKYDANGIEQFVVKVVKKEVAYAVVSAANAELAQVAAKAAFASGKLDVETEVTTEDWTR